MGRYNLEAEASGFKIVKRNDLVIDLDSALQTDLSMEMIEKIEEVTVLENGVQIETASTQVGEVVSTPADDGHRFKRTQLYRPVGAASPASRLCRRSSRTRS